MTEFNYHSKAWRELPRDGDCVVSFLFGERAGDCDGPNHRHHVDRATDRTVQVCAKHHPKLESALRHLLDEPVWKRCPHKPGTHRYKEGKIACERMLNRDLIATLQTAA